MQAFMHLPAPKATDKSPWPPTLPPNPWYDQHQVPLTSQEVVVEGDRVIGELLEDLGK